MIADCSNVTSKAPPLRWSAPRLDDDRPYRSIFLFMRWRRRAVRRIVRWSVDRALAGEYGMRACIVALRGRFLARLEVQ